MTAKKEVTKKTLVEKLKIKSKSKPKEEVKKEVGEEKTDIIMIVPKVEDKQGWNKGIVKAFKELNKVKWYKKQKRDILLIKPGFGMLKVEDADMLSLLTITDDNVIDIIRTVQNFVADKAGVYGKKKDYSKEKIVGRASHFLHGLIQELKRIDIE